MTMTGRCNLIKKCPFLEHLNSKCHDDEVRNFTLIEDDSENETMQKEISDISACIFIDQFQTEAVHIMETTGISATLT